MKKNLILTLVSFAAITGISIIINFTGYKWGLPTEGHLYSYHPDEGINIGGAIRIFAGEKVPGFYNYSSLYFYLTAYVLSVASVLGILDIKETLTPENLTVIYTCGRVTSLLFSAASAGLVFLAGYKLKGLKAGIISGLLFVSVPIFAMHSKFIAVDVTCGFFVALSLYVSAFITFPNKETDIFSAENRRRFMLPLCLSAVAAGLAMGTKYNGIIVFACPLTLLVCGLLSKKLNTKNFIVSLIISGAAALLVFLITTPGIFLDTEHFIKDFTYEINHIKTGHGEEFVSTGVGIFYTFYRNMFCGMGIILSVLSIISLFVCLFDKNIYIKSAAVFVLVYYISVSAGNVRFARYLIPALSGFCLCAGFVFSALLEKKNKILTAFLTVILVSALIPNIKDCIFYDTVCIKQDIRDTVYAFMLENCKGKTIGMPTVPWFYSPPFIKETSVMRQERYKNSMACREFSLKCLPNETDEWNSKFLNREMPDFVLISSTEEYHKKRLDKQEYKDYMSVINEYYTKTDIHTSDFDKKADRYMQNLPGDMAYIHPSFTLYRKK